MPRAIQQQGKTIMKKAWIAVTLAIVTLCSAPAARAADWWPVKVYDMDSGKPVETDYAPLPKGLQGMEYLRAVPAHEGHVLGRG